MPDLQSSQPSQSRSSDASSSTVRGSAGRGRFGHPASWYVAAAVLLATSTLVAVRQQPRSDVYRATSAREPEWWLQPVEFNAARRLPLVWSDLNDLFVLPGDSQAGPQVWVVGNGGLILHSADLGRTWKQVSLAAPARSAPPAASKAAAAGASPLDAVGWLALLGAPPEGGHEVGPRPGSQSQQQQAPVQQTAPASPPAQTVAKPVEPGGGATGASAPSVTPASPPDAGIGSPPSSAAKPRLAKPRTAPRTTPTASGAAGLGRAAASSPSTASRPPAPTDRPSPAVDLTKANLRSVWFIDRTTGWVAGDHGALFVTHDGGESWSRQLVIDAESRKPLESALSQLMFLNPTSGLLTTGAWWQPLEPWYRYKTDDGLHWRRAKLNFLNVVPFDRSRLSRPAGRVGVLQVPSRETVMALDRRAGDDLWLVGTHGLVLQAVNRDKTWVPRDLGTRATLTAILFLDARHGWIAGAQGTLLATEDSGQTWFRQARRTPALGSDPAANERLAAREAASLGPYSMWLAPWYYVSLIAVAALLVPALRPGPPVVPEPSVAERLVSDRAIDRREADAFDFNAVALGLSRFLRNAKTQPPLTIAVTGEWGSGKSSLMNLLRVDLRRYGFRPVWFNAWHHQKEDHLLASLLAAVRAQGVPPWWRPEGALFRARLLRIRAARYWFLAALLLIAFAFSAGYLRAAPGRLEAAETAAAGLLDKLNALFPAAGKTAKTPDAPRLVAPTPPPAPGPAASPAGAPGEGPAHLPLAALALTTGGLLAAGVRGAKAFGVNPARLLARRSTKVRDLEALTGFRYRFAAEFSDVTAALNPRTMLILIDDLDRCRPEMVLEVLEAVNFLVTSGECFVVLGMARDRVLRCVGLGFKDVASELLDAPATPPAGLTEDDLARQRRLEFAQQYLEKLVNIEVPVPTPTDEQSLGLLVAARAAAAAKAPPVNRWRQLLRAARRALPAAAVVLFLVGGFVTGLTRRPAPPKAGGALTGPADVTRLPPVPAPPTISVPGGQAAKTGQKPAGDLPAPPPVLAGPMRWRRLPFLVLALALAGLGVWRLSMPPDVVIHDSREFEEALSRWHPLIFSWRNTPRAIKRYLNRVRYLAMLQREPAATPSLWQAVWLKLIALLGKHAHRQESAKGPAPIPEEVLVALSALELRHPAWITGDRPLSARAAEPGADAQTAELLAERGDLERYRYRYRELASGIRMSGEGRAA
ncbi:MAG TPA: P-loop NTPase fold protein [Thermoanaerobaculia bacterium]